VKSDEEIGKEAAGIAREKVLKLAQEVKLTPKKVLQRISEGLDAIENKVFYDKDRGKCITSPDLIAHHIRLDSAKLGLTVLDMNPSEKHDVNINGDINMLLKEIDGSTTGLPSKRKGKNK